MKDIKNYLIESSEDGKNGHWEEFSDEDTGEITQLWVDDPTPEELAKREKEREADWNAYWEKREKEDELHKQLKIDDLEDAVWDLKSELKDLHDEYRQLEIDQEEEVGGLYVQGKEAEAEKLAQKYGELFNKNSKRQETIKRKLQAAKYKLHKAKEKMWKLRDELWG